MPDRANGRLDRLLDLRKHVEDECTAELGLARKAVQKAESELDALEDQRRELHHRIATSEGESVGRIQTMTLLLDRLDQGIQNAKMARTAALTTLRRTAERLVDANRDRRSLEKVVDRRAEDERLERLARERKREDEVAITRFLNGSQSPEGER